MCNYSGRRTWRDECCEAWKPKGKRTNMVEVVRCKDCKNGGIDSASYPHYWCNAHSEYHEADFFCADVEQKDGEQE